MLKKRIITAVILLPLAILGILYLPPFYFMMVNIIVFGWAAWEWTRLSGCESTRSRLLGLASMGALILLGGAVVLLTALMMLPEERASGFYAFLGPFSRIIGFTLPPLIWCLALCAVWMYPKGSWLYSSKAIGLGIGTLILVPACVAMLILQRYNPLYLLYPMILVWSADTGAFFAGRRWGRHKLAPDVSPGKTWEGVLGGLVVSFGVALIAFFVLDVQKYFLLWMLIAIITVLSSVLGDLFESLFKRLRNIKDSGTLLPGHGGLLDRIDGLIPAMPIFMLGMIVGGF